MADRYKDLDNPSRAAEAPARKRKRFVLPSALLALSLSPFLAPPPVAAQVPVPSDAVVRQPVGLDKAIADLRRANDATVKMKAIEAQALAAGRRVALVSLKDMPTGRAERAANIAAQLERSVVRFELAQFEALGLPAAARADVVDALRRYVREQAKILAQTFHGKGQITTAFYGDDPLVPPAQRWSIVFAGLDEKVGDAALPAMIVVDHERFHAEGEKRFLKSPQFDSEGLDARLATLLRGHFFLPREDVPGTEDRSGLLERNVAELAADIYSGLVGLKDGRQEVIDAIVRFRGQEVREVPAVVAGMLESGVPSEYPVLRRVVGHHTLPGLQKFKAFAQNVADGRWDEVEKTLQEAYGAYDPAKLAEVPERVTRLKMIGFAGLSAQGRLTNDDTLFELSAALAQIFTPKPQDFLALTAAALAQSQMGEDATPDKVLQKAKAVYEGKIEGSAARAVAKGLFGGVPMSPEQEGFLKEQLRALDQTKPTPRAAQRGGFWRSVGARPFSLLR